MKKLAFPSIWTLLSFIAAGVVGYCFFGNHGIFPAVAAVGILSVLEISLSFDNAVANAAKLEHMDPVWQQRFMKFGIPIAVLGMRTLFPILIIGISAHIGPIHALKIAIQEPKQYASILTEARPYIMAYGGSYLGMIAMKFLFDADKEVHWISFIESRLTFLGDLEAIEIAIVLFVLYLTSTFAPDNVHQGHLLAAGIFGLISFIMVEALGSLLEKLDEKKGNAARKGFGAFMYLEMMDASFSFDGVIGAFAISTNIFIIALGLGIGAVWVRYLTLVLVEKKALTEYRYLEHGALWAIAILYILMMVSIRYDLPEIYTGLLGVGCLASAWLSSILYNKRVAQGQVIT